VRAHLCGALPRSVFGARPGRADPRSDRIAGLDGIRGIAAPFVVINHIYLRARPGNPVGHAPFWAAEFVYGRFAVVVFIVLSGFSLGLAPARSGWRFDSVGRFAHRRAWRTLPPYWAALCFSLVMTWFVVAQPGWALPDRRSVSVYGLLVQDAVPLRAPNRAFWSIAVEVQLYVLLTLLLVVIRRVSALAMVATVAAVAVTVDVLGPHVPVLGHALITLTPNLAVLFAIGLLAAGIGTASVGSRSRPWGALTVAASVPVVALIAVAGPTWSNAHLFWLDLDWWPGSVTCSQPSPPRGPDRPCDCWIPGHCAASARSPTACTSRTRRS
jgi:peptidoglycan/LPS O-acetylase OafA/YrhL